MENNKNQSGYPMGDFNQQLNLHPGMQGNQQNYNQANMNGMPQGMPMGNQNYNQANMNGMPQGMPMGNQDYNQVNMNGMPQGMPMGNQNYNQANMNGMPQGMPMGNQDYNQANMNGMPQGMPMGNQDYNQVNMNGMPQGNVNFGMSQMGQQVEVANQELDYQTLTAYKQRLRSLPEVQSLTGEIEVQNPNSIIAFGQTASESISKISDELLASMRTVKAEEASEMLTSLTKIMDKFDVTELEKVKEDSMISKLFKNVGNTVAKMFQKYDTMGYEVEKVYVLLKKYETDIRESNAHLKKLYDGNLHYYQMLEKYIVAGELALEEIDQYIQAISNDATMAEEERQMMLQKLEICKEMLSQRVYDLQIAENVAIQAAPMIQTIQMSNFNLMRKINSSFIITLPIFKQCLAQAIILKRQEIQAKSIKQLDEKTNELIMRNATCTANQSVAIAKMASGSSIQIETLEKSYETIMKGIEETKAIQSQNEMERQENSKRLENIKHTMTRTNMTR